MSDLVDSIKDYVHDLRHSLADTLTGVIKPSPAPKPAYTKYDAAGLGTGIAAAGAQTIRARKSQVDKAISDAGG